MIYESLILKVTENAVVSRCILMTAKVSNDERLYVEGVVCGV